MTLVLTWMFRRDLSSVQFAPPLVSLFFASFLVIPVALSSATLPDLTLLPLNALWAGVPPKLWLHHHHACSDGVTLPTRLVAL